MGAKVTCNGRSTQRASAREFVLRKARDARMQDQTPLNDSLICWLALLTLSGARNRSALRSGLLRVRFAGWLLVWLGTMTTASAQPGEGLPFVEPGGLLQSGLTRGMVVSQLGPPPITRDHYEAGDPPLTGALVFEYPNLGLAFVVPPVERPAADPRVAFLVVKKPAASRTPEGLGIGMHWSEVRARNPGGRFEDKGGRIDWIDSPDAGSRKASLLVTTGNVVEYMVFDAGIPHEAAYRAWIKPVRQVLAGVLLLLLILLVPWLLKTYPAYLARKIAVQAPMRAWLGKGMLMLSPVLLVAGLAVPREEGSIALLGVIMILGGAGLLLPAAFNLALGGTLTPARLWLLGLIGTVTVTLTLVFLFR